MAKAKSKAVSLDVSSPAIGVWASLIRELGIPSFLVLFFVFCFLGFASPAQKSEKDDIKQVMDLSLI
jgi:hypothetical protein